MSEMIEMIVVEEPGAFEIAALLSDLWNTLLRVLKGRVDGLLAMKSDNPEAAKDQSITHSLSLQMLTYSRRPAVGRHALWV